MNTHVQRDLSKTKINLLETVNRPHQISYQVLYNRELSYSGLVLSWGVSNLGVSVSLGGCNSDGIIGLEGE